MRTYPEVVAEIGMVEKNLKSAKSPKMKKHYKNLLKRLKKEKGRFEGVFYGNAP